MLSPPQVAPAPGRCVHPSKSRLCSCSGLISQKTGFDVVMEQMQKWSCHLRASAWERWEGTVMENEIKYNKA